MKLWFRNALLSGDLRRQAALALALLVSMVIGFATLRVVMPGIRQRRAVSVLEADGVSIVYDVPAAAKAGWCEKLTGQMPDSWIDFFYNVNLVNFPLESEARPGIDVRNLAAFPRLRELDLQAHEVSTDEIAVIGGLHELQTLTISWPISDESASRLAGLKRLSRLTLDASRLTDDGVARLASLPSLRSLELDESGFSGRGLASLQNVTFLWLAGGTIGDEAIGHISRMRELRELRLQWTRVRSIEGLERLEHLSDLMLDGSPITDDGLRNVGRMNSLDGLYVRYTQITDVALHYISEVQGLTHLALGDTRISDKGMQHLRRLTKLETLEINNTAVTDAGALELARLPTLERLSIDDTTVTEAARRRILGAEGEPSEETGAGR